MPTMLSRRAYAKRNNISERRVRTLIADGVIVAAVDAKTDLVDAQKADRLLADHTTKPKAGRTPVLLSTAKQRRARAVCRDLLDEAAHLRRNLVPPGLAERHINATFAPLARTARDWVGPTAAAVVGRPADEVQRGLKKGVNDLLGQMYEHLVAGDGSKPDAAPTAEPDLEALTPVQLTAHIEHLRAEILELGRLERRRHLVRVEDIMPINDETLTTAKSRLLAIPGRLDARISDADVEEAKKLLAAEIEGFISAARVDLSSLTKE